jgi:hypothetical protein
MAKKLTLADDKEYTLILTGTEVASVINKVVELPYNQSAEMMDKIVEQVEQQNLKFKENG